jgi:hypothetical protein
MSAIVIPPAPEPSIEQVRAHNARLISRNARLRTAVLLLLQVVRGEEADATRAIAFAEGVLGCQK